MSEIVAPAGALDSASFNITMVDAQNFVVTIPTQSLPGPYSVQIGPAITNAAGTRTLAGGVFTPIYSTAFEAIDAAEKIARLSPFRTFSQLSI